MERDFWNRIRLLGHMALLVSSTKGLMNMNKLKNGDMITDNGISYVIEMDEDGTLWGVSNNAEYEIEISEDYVPDEVSFSA